MDPVLAAVKDELIDTIRQGRQKIADKRISRSEVTEQLQFLKVLLSRFERLRENFEDNINTRKKRTEQNSDEIRKELIQITIEAERLIVKLETATQDLDAPLLQRENENNTSKLVCVKLPKLEIEPFSGNIFKFQEFWQIFSSNIDKHPNLNDVDKFHLLVTHLRGKAKDCIDGITLTGENYETAKDRLRERFGDVQVLLDRHYSEIQRLPKASKFGNSLRDTLDGLEIHIRCLQNLGEDIDQRYFITTIMSKFPPHIRLEIQKKRLDGEFSTEELLLFIKKLVTAHERVFSAQYFEDKYNDTAQKPSNNLYTTQTLIGDEPRSFRKCVFCENNNHWSDECDKYTGLESRKKIINGRCLICLSRRHRTQSCNVDKPCFYCRKTNNHHRSLCPTLFENQITERLTEECGLMSLSEKVSMQTASMTIVSPTQTIKVRGLFDSGSQRTYITEDLLKSLKLPIKGKQILSVFTFGNMQPKNVSSPIVDLNLKLNDNTNFSITANVVPTITGSFINCNFDVTKLNLDKKYKLSDDDRTKPIQMLIGNDYYYDLVQREKIEILKGLYLINSKVGWILSGRYSDNALQRDIVTFLSYSDADSLLTESSLQWIQPDSWPSFENEKNLIKTLWDLDTIGIKELPDENDDDKAIELFNNSVKMNEDDGRYYVSWPWKSGELKLTTGYALALGRLNSLFKKMTDKSLLLEYDKIFKQQLENGIIEKVKEKSSANIVHYLPHHPVITPTKTTTKIRIVFDASAKERRGDKSLNEMLYRGRIFLEDLAGLLLRFRCHKYVLTADIEKAFLQIGLHESDRDVTRFIWVKDIENGTSPNNLEIFRFRRVAFGVISSPFLLNAVVKHHLYLWNSNVAQKISNHLYVDNLVIGVDSEENALNLYKEGKEIFNNAQMNLREWHTNVLSVNEIENSKIEEMKVLGITWNIKDDFIQVTSKASQDSNTLTKREILSKTSSFFDPLGFFSPVMLQAKLFLRELWGTNSWDEALSTEQIQKWIKIKDHLNEIPQFKIPRFICSADPSQDTSAEFHCFTDASKDAYAAVIYLRLNVQNGFKSNLIFSKTRVAPSSSTTIPRLELLGVLIGVRLLNYVEQIMDLKVKRKFLWTDSKCVLYWIKSEKVQGKFVENRLREIKQNKTINFNYVPSKENPADLGSRGCNCEELNSFWWEGPEWILKPEEDWLSRENNLNSFDEIQEIEEELDSPTFSNTDTKTEIVSPYGIKADKFSEFKKLLRITAYCTRFVSSTQKRPVSTSKIINGFELNRAELLWIKYIQQKHFSNVLIDMQNSKNNNLQRQLGLFLSRGILKCKGRMMNQEFDFEENFPTLLPNDEKYTELLIIHIHTKLAHSGVSHTLAEIRKTHWIIKGRATVRKTLKKCSICKFYNCGPFSLPPMPILPYARVSRSFAFTYTGLDYLGPLFIKGQSNSKVWICLFTCMATRAIHLEVVQGLSAVEFLMALRRFVGRRNVPRQIITDNAPQFKLTKTLLDETWKNIINNDEVGHYLSRQNIVWKFIPEFSPWMGGFYERLVGLVKNCLKKTIWKRHLTLMELITITVEIEAILNTRPLTYVSDDIESNNILTPAHFLTLHNNQNLGTYAGTPTESEDPNFNFSATTKDKLIDSWHRGQSYLNEFWISWKTEYLFALRERRQTNIVQGKSTNHIHPRVGNIVLIGDRTPRGNWKTGQLYPIEIEEIKEDDLDEETHEEDFTQNIKSEGPQQNYRTTRKRSATELAERRTRKIFEDEDD